MKISDTAPLYKNKPHILPSPLFLWKKSDPPPPFLNISKTQAPPFYNGGGNYVYICISVAQLSVIYDIISKYIVDIITTF